MKIFRIICFIKCIFRSLKYAYWFGPGDDFFDGCDYVEQEDDTLVCKICGKVSE